MFRAHARVEPPPAGAGGSPEQRDLPELLTRDASLFTVARKRFPPQRELGDAKARDCYGIPVFTNPASAAGSVKGAEQTSFTHAITLLLSGPYCRSE
jgi:hypothetical protein